MKVLDLLAEIEEICDTASKMPLVSNKILIDKSEMLEIIKEIRQVLPEEIQQAQFVMNERQRILEQAKQEYELLLKDAEKQAEQMVDQNEITVQAKQRAREIMTNAENKSLQLKMGTFEYIDKALYDFQTQVDQLHEKYFGDMIENLQRTFDEINNRLQHNREEIKNLAYKTQVDGEQA